MIFPRQFLPAGPAILAITAALAVPAWSQAPFNECPAKDAVAQIEVLPFSGMPPFSIEGDTCDGGKGALSSYNSSTCTIPGDTYTGPDDIYKVWLHKGNKDVKFHLQSQEQADLPADLQTDLVLALIKPCGNNQCVSNSTDFIGLHIEEISAANYDPDVYYLVVDSAEGAPCGHYTLTVTGENPTPDLELKLTASKTSVIAGEELIYTLTVTNHGKLDATGVQVTQNLPAGVDIKSTSGCAVSGRVVTCSIGNLAINDPKERKIVVSVNSATRGKLITTADVKANEGEPTPGNNKPEPITTTVEAKSDLSISANATLESVVAGKDSLTYTLTVANAGPSDATKVVVTDTLPAHVTFMGSTPGSDCGSSNGTVMCRFDRIAVGRNKSASFTVAVLPSARGSLTNTAKVTAAEREPPPPPPPLPSPEANNSVSRRTKVRRVTNLKITLLSPAEVIAGGEPTYEITVYNVGPSDSSKSPSVTVTLPDKVTFVPGSGPCLPFQESVTCETGPIALGQTMTVRFKAKVDPSLRPRTLINKAVVQVAPADEGDSMSVPWNTIVKVNADLRVVEMTAQPVRSIDNNASVIAGENLLYTVAVMNEGLSNSLGGMLHYSLGPGLTFVASPDGCYESENIVSCKLLGSELQAHDQTSRRFVVKVSSSATEDIINRACVESDDYVGEVCSPFSPTKVITAADLAVSLTDSPDPVVPGTPPAYIAYTFAVTNNGPSDAKNVTATLKLQEGTQAYPGCSSALTEMSYTIDSLTAGDSGSFDLKVCPPDKSDTVKTTEASATAYASPDTEKCPDSPTCNDNKVSEATTLADNADADLSITKKAEVEAVVAGDLLRYTIKVANHGPVDAVDVSVQDTLPAGVIFDSVTCEDCTAGEMTCSEAGGKVMCDLVSLAKDEPRSLTLTVRVLANAQSPLKNTASVSTSPSDPNMSNNETKPVVTSVVHAPPLVLPFFEVESPPEGKSTLFAVKNFSKKSACVQYEYLPASQAPPPAPTCIATKAIDSINLRDQDLFQPPGVTSVSGHVGIKPVECAANCNACDNCTSTPELSGDFIQTDPASGASSGLPLVSTDTSRKPPELCRRWSVRFLNDKTLKSSTDLLFFVPGNSSTAQPVAVGKVFTEEGKFVQEISINEPQEAFRRTTAATDLDLLANFGSIEWEFPEGVVGNVSAVYKADGKYAVAVPGFCRDGNRGASSLIVPYFEVNANKPVGITTLVALRNETEGDFKVSLNYNYSSSSGPGMLTKEFQLGGHATWTVNLRDVKEFEEKERITGFVQVESTVVLSQVESTGVLSQVKSAGVLSGDFLVLDPAKPAAWGGALLDADRHPPQLCRYWDVRFLQDEPVGTATDFIFYPATATATATGTVYLEDGTLKEPLGVSILQPASRVHARDLILEGVHLNGRGSIEWNLGEGIVGNVSAVFTLDGFSVLVPGVCRVPVETP